MTLRRGIDGERKGALPWPAGQPEAEAAIVFYDYLMWGNGLDSFAHRLTATNMAKQALGWSNHGWVVLLVYKFAFGLFSSQGVYHCIKTEQPQEQDVLDLSASPQKKRPSVAACASLGPSATDRK